MQIGDHLAHANWTVPNCRLDIMLGTPWHVANNRRKDYQLGMVIVGKLKLPLIKQTFGILRVRNISGIKFGSIFLNKARKSNSDKDIFRVYEDVQRWLARWAASQAGDWSRDWEKSSLQTTTPKYFPTLASRADSYQKIHHRSPSKTQDTPDQITLRCSPFFARKKRKLREVLYHRALNRSKKHDIASIPRTEKKFWQSGISLCFLGAWSKIWVSLNYNCSWRHQEDCSQTWVWACWTLSRTYGLRECPCYLPSTHEWHF